MKSVGICETQPITAEGLRSILDGCPDFEYHKSVGSILEASAMLRREPPDILLVDKGLGAHAVLAWTADLRETGPSVAVVIWGHSISEPEALRLLQNGVRGILRKNSTPDRMLSCLRAVAAGNSWMEESLFRETSRRDRSSRSQLTPRESQVLELVEQGLKNKEIARELGIRPGTVKIHLKHIFEKTGVRGRYGLALTGMREKGILSLPPM